MAPVLRDRLRAGDGPARLREVAARCALERAPDLLIEVAKELFDEGQTVRLLELAHDAKTHTKRFGDTDTHAPSKPGGYNNRLSTN